MAGALAVNLLPGRPELVMDVTEGKDRSIVAIFEDYIERKVEVQANEISII